MTAFERSFDEGQAALRDGDWALALERFGAAERVLPADAHAERARLTRTVGSVHRRRGHLDAARRAYEESLNAATRSGLQREVAAALNSLGVVEQLSGEMESAEALYERAESAAADAGDEYMVNAARQNLATLASIRGDLQRALERYRLVLESCEASGNTLTAASILNNMGMAHAELGEWSEAESCYARAEQWIERAGDPTTLAQVALNRADLYIRSERPDRAREPLDLAFTVFDQIQSQSGIAEAYRLYSALYRDAGRADLADLHLDVVLGLARSCEDRLLEAEVERDRALLHLAEGRNRDALVALNAAHRLFMELHAERALVDVDRRLDRLEGNYLRVVQVWGESIEAKDEYTAGHCERVADYTCMMASAVGFGGRDLHWIRMGAFLHDVGKTAVSPALLNKPGKLTEDEFELVRRHTVLGDAIVAELGFPWDIRPMVRNHHERWNGTGYPDGLAGEEIPLTARILCIADVYDALTTARSYRPALPHEVALAEMEKEAGTVLDPRLFEVFRREIDAARRQPAVAGGAAEEG